MDEHSNAEIPKRLQGRELALEGMLSSEFGRRECRAGAKALAQLRSSRASLRAMVCKPQRGRSPLLGWIEWFDQAWENLAVGQLMASVQTWVALASCGVILGVLYYFMAQGQAPVVAKVATLEGKVTVERGRKMLALTEGMSVRAGDVLRLAATEAVALTYRDESSLRIRGPGQTKLAVRLNGGKHLELVGGITLQGQVTHQPEGQPMMIVTPDARATVLGTKLKVSTAGDLTQLDVIEGRVRLSRFSDGATVEVATGQSVQARPLGDFKVVPSDAPDLVVTGLGFGPQKASGQNGLYVTVRNQGTKATTAGKTVWVKLTIDGNQDNLWLSHPGPLEPGQSVTLEAQGEAMSRNRSRLESGRHVLKATVDPVNYLWESDEFNNSLTQSINVQ